MPNCVLAHRTPYLPKTRDPPSVCVYVAAAPHLRPRQRLMERTARISRVGRGSCCPSSILLIPKNILISYKFSFVYNSLRHPDERRQPEISATSLQIDLRPVAISNMSARRDNLGRQQRDNRQQRRRQPQWVSIADKTHKHTYEMCWKAAKLSSVLKIDGLFGLILVVDR